jgi:hypothetical protein
MATPLHSRLKQGLDEARILVLGAQILLGFEFRAFLQPGFDRLPVGAQYAKLGGLGLLLVTLALVISPAPFHRLAERGEDTRRMNRMVSAVMNIVLVPFALALGIDVFVAVASVGVTPVAFAGGIAILVAALSAWYGLALVGRWQGAGARVPDSERDKEDAMAEAKGTTVDTKIDHVLTEARVVLPGVQALLGFQLAGVLTDAFEELPRSSQVTHLVSLGALAVAAVLLIAPAAYHRLVEAGENTEHFHRVASNLILSALGPLAVAIALDVAIVVRKLTESLTIAIGSGIFIGLLFMCAWYFVPVLVRRRHHSDETRTWAPAA